MKSTILLSEKSSNLINPIQNKAKQMNKKNLIGNKRKLSSSSILQKK